MTRICLRLFAVLIIMDNCIFEITWIWTVYNVSFIDSPSYVLWPYLLERNKSNSLLVRQRSFISYMLFLKMIVEWRLKYVCTWCLQYTFFWKMVLKTFPRPPNCSFRLPSEHLSMNLWTSNLYFPSVPIAIFREMCLRCLLNIMEFRLMYTPKNGLLFCMYVKLELSFVGVLFCASFFCIEFWFF